MSALTAETKPEAAVDRFDILRLENQLCFGLYAAAHAMNRAYRVALGPLGLTYPQYLVMLSLWEFDKQSVSELGGRLRLDSGTLTPVLKRLETAGIVGRARSRADEREVEISLTERGKALKVDALAVPNAVRCQLGLSNDEIIRMRADFDLLISRLDASTACATE